MKKKKVVKSKMMANPLTMERNNPMEMIPKVPLKKSSKSAKGLMKGKY